MRPKSDVPDMGKIWLIRSSSIGPKQGFRAPVDLICHRFGLENAAKRHENGPFWGRNGHEMPSTTFRSRFKWLCCRNRTSPAPQQIASTVRPEEFREELRAEALKSSHPGGVHIDILVCNM